MEFHVMRNYEDVKADVYILPYFVTLFVSQPYRRRTDGLRERCNDLGNHE